MSEARLFLKRSEYDKTRVFLWGTNDYHQVVLTAQLLGSQLLQKLDNEPNGVLEVKIIPVRAGTD